ncbi:MAG: hypothetical protein ABW003_06330 [Microvirga sp.]
MAQPEKQQEADGDKRDRKDSGVRADEDARLDHGIKESFPGSDPVSVEVSKYAPGDPRAGETSPGGSTTPRRHEEGNGSVLEQAREAVVTMADKAEATAKDLSERGRKMAPKLANSPRIVQETLREHPLSAVIIAGLIGCGIALVAYEILSGPRSNKMRRRAYGADEIS